MVIESKNILRYSDVRVALNIQVGKITLKTLWKKKERENKGKKIALMYRLKDYERLC